MPPSVMGQVETVEGGAAAAEVPVVGARRKELTGTVGSCGCEICNTADLTISPDLCT